METYYIVVRENNILFCTSTGHYHGHREPKDVVVVEGIRVQRLVAAYFDALNERKQVLKWARRTA